MELRTVGTSTMFGKCINSTYATAEVHCLCGADADADFYDNEYLPLCVGTSEPRPRTDGR